MSRRPRLYFSFRSPYSWLALERLRREVPDILARVEPLPYWDPDVHTARALDERGAQPIYHRMSRAKHLYVLQDTKRAAAELGLPMAWPLDREPWWEVPHLAWLAARRAGHEEACYDAVIEARWGRGEDVCDRATLARALARTGLECGWADAVDDPGIREEAVGALVLAWQDDVFGVPYLILGRQRFWGLDRVAHFLHAWRGVTSEGPDGSALPPVAVGAYDHDTAGGCG